VNTFLTWRFASRARVMSTNSESILGANGHLTQARALHDVAATRLLEQTSLNSIAEGTLMAMAGEATAKLALALAPHANTFWVACGPGNNGGDGFQAARYLKQWGKNPVISYLAQGKPSADAAAARDAAQQAGVQFIDCIPPEFDAGIDALFGIGALRPFNELHAGWIAAMNASAKPLLAVDLPSGLNADTGVASALHVCATNTLSLLTLKPGLFTAHGRDACGAIWFNGLGVAQPETASAGLIAMPKPLLRRHSSHKGNFGDVAVIGGAQGMDGAAVLAGSAALHGGAGRVFVCLLAAHSPSFDAHLPELMFRRLEELDLSKTTVVAGCGGGEAIGIHLAAILQTAYRLALDADALNQIAKQSRLQALLAKRDPERTVITPHPLEAARLLEIRSEAVQSDRLRVAKTLAQRFNCTVVLKGSGTVVAFPGRTPEINVTGNAKLATAGTGDVLAGLVGAHLASGQSAFHAACDAVYQHGHVADVWPHSRLTASALSHALQN